MRTRTLTFGSAAAIALALAGCSSPAPTDADPTTTETAPPQAEAGLIVEADPSTLTTTDQVQPDSDQAVIVPSGQVSVDSIATAETIPASVTASADGVAASDGGGDEELVPADGEEFRVVTVTYSEPDSEDEATAVPGNGDGTSEAAPDGATLGFEIGGQSQQQPTEGTGTKTYLVSVPTGEDAFLTITEEGKTQKVDLASGERDAATEAAGYYRQDPSGTSIELGEVEAEASSGLEGEVRKSATFAPQLTISGVEFTAWTPEQGWAEDGSAWLTIDGDLELGKSGDAELQAAVEVQGTLEAEGQEPTTFEVALEKSGAFTEDTAPFSETIAVPADAEAVTVTASGEVVVSASASWTMQSDSNAVLDEVKGEVPLE